VIDTAGVQAMLPHRYPVSLVDRVLAVVPGERITAVKAVTCNEPCFAHDGPAPSADWFRYPETLLVESWGQAAGILAILTGRDSGEDLMAGRVMLLGSVSGVDFHSPVRPGEVVEHEVRLVRAVSDTMIFAGHGSVGGVPVLSVTSAVMALRPAEALAPGTDGEGERS
jgi:3-hydroxyacyl-[acyl-carrier-protein] dehydratase